MLTPEYLELKFIEAIADNTKIFFGEKVHYLSLQSLLCVVCVRVYWAWTHIFVLQVPSMILDQRLLGNFLQEISRNTSMKGSAYA